MAMSLVERVVKISVEPVDLGNKTKEEWHLGVIIWCVIVSSTDRVETLVEAGGNDLVSPVVVGLLSHVLREVR